MHNDRNSTLYATRTTRSLGPRGATLALAAVLVLGACAPTAEQATVEDIPCATTPQPTVAIVEFENTTAQHGTHVTGVEEAATARMITELKESGCYKIVEQSVLQDIIMDQGLESTDPVDLAKAAGAGYVITGTVTRATIARPGVNAFGVAVGATNAQVEVDVRATDIITGEVVVSMTGRGDASNPNITARNLPVGTLSYNDPTVEPLLAQASSSAVQEAANAIRRSF